jgi:class 3 adenylate cyclase/CHASE2 domain-containing sensor protein
MTKAKTIDGWGLGSFGLGALTWWLHDDTAMEIAIRAPGIGFPLAALVGKVLAALLLVIGLYRLRQSIAALTQRALQLLDEAYERLETLPRWKSLFLRSLAPSLAVGGSILLLAGGTNFETYLETRAIDASFRLRFPERSQAELATGRALSSANRQEHVVMVALDDETIAHLGWPLPRRAYAQLIDAIASAKPQSITFDMAFVDPSRDHPEWDRLIGEAAQRAGSVTFSYTAGRVTGGREASEPSLAALDANTLPWHESAAGLPEYSNLVGGDVAPQPVIEPIASHASALGLANVVLDGDDDVLRHGLTVARLKRRLMPGLSLRVAANALGVSLADIRVLPGSHVDLGGKRRIPIDGLGRTLVRYQGRHDSHGGGPFRYVPMWSLIRPEVTVTLADNPLGEDQRFVIDENTEVVRDGRRLALADVAAGLSAGITVSGQARFAPEPGHVDKLVLGAPATGEVELLDETTLRFSTVIGTARPVLGDASSLAGKHVLIGSTALAAADVRNSPLGAMPGVEHHATMLANILAGDFFLPAPRWASGALVVVGSFAAAAAAVSLSTGASLLVSLGFMLTLLASGFGFASSGVYLPVMMPTVGVAATTLVCLVLGVRAAQQAHAKAAQERAFVRQTFGRYLTDQVVEQLLDSPDGLKLGGQRGFVTIMMTDLRGFTSMCGSMEPENVVKLLNHYLEAMTRIIARYGGTIDEFIGDAILVVFGAPLRLEHAEQRAVACAIEMLNAMPEVNTWNVSNGLPQVEMGIGVHSGEVVLGNIGSELRAKYGIVGATINLTSRVESFTVGGQVLISEATRERCGQSVTIGASQSVSPKGVKGALQIHEALAVTAPFEVRLQTTQDTLNLPSSALRLRWAAVKGKEVAALVNTANVEAISERGLVLRLDQPVALLSDLQLRVLEGDTMLPGDLYGKVLRVESSAEVVYLRLTSVPAELKGRLEAARAGAPVTPPVSDSVLVTS